MKRGAAAVWLGTGLIVLAMLLTACGDRTAVGYTDASPAPEPALDGALAVSSDARVMSSGISTPDDASQPTSHVDQSDWTGKDGSFSADGCDLAWDAGQTVGSYKGSWAGWTKGPFDSQRTYFEKSLSLKVTWPDPSLPEVHLQGTIVNMGDGVPLKGALSGTCDCFGCSGDFSLGYENATPLEGEFSGRVDFSESPLTIGGDWRFFNTTYYWGLGNWQATPVQ